MAAPPLATWPRWSKLARRRPSPQFFVNERDNARLDWFSAGTSKHPVFGKVVSGYEVVVGITEAPTGASGKDVPNAPIVMESVTIEGL